MLGGLILLEAFEHEVVRVLQDILPTIGWAGIVFIMALESANIPIPSEVTMPLAGWMLGLDKGLSAIETVLLAGFMGALGCTLGSVGSYALGAYGGRPFLEKYGRYIMVNRHDLEKADEWFGRWGDWASFISRLLPIVRTFISFPAGVVRVDFRRFTVLTFTGSFLWCGALAWGGWHFGANWEEILRVTQPLHWPIIIVAGIGFLWYVWHHIRRGREALVPLPEESSE
jgi:membrane protein DedA with SNARE-associated domain